MSPIPMKQIADIIKQGESETVEFKTSFGKDVIETAVAFANTRGGTILIGISDDGDIVGTTCGVESLQVWANEIKQNTSPSIIPTIEPVRFKNKTVVCIRVGEFPVKPVAFKDRYYRRVANSNHRMTLTEMANMHLQSLQLSWDAYPDEQSSFQQLSNAKIARFLERVRQGGRFQVEGEQSVVLEKLGYLKNGAPTHAARLLFGENDPPYSLHIGRFKTPSTIIDDRMIRGTLFEAAEEAMQFIISHLKVAFEITGKIERNEIFEYPVSALRELLLNTVVHRDYTSPTDIQIKIFDNAITFFNPGKLYGGLTVEDLKTDSYQSRTRNRLIAEAFYLTRDIEKYGSGYLRVRKALREYPSMNFQYEESGDGFLVTLSYLHQKTTSDSADEGINEGINELLEQIRKIPGQRVPHYAKVLKASSKTIERWISELRERGAIEHRGSNKTGGYWPL